MNEILVLYYSRQGSTAALARQVCRGVETIPGMQARLRTVAPVAATTERLDPSVPNEGPPYASHDDLVQCCGLILGSPTRFGNMAAQMRNFLDQAGGLWFQNKLVGKAASVFCSTATQHGGQESTILTFIPTILHLGMIYVGLPYTFSGQFGYEEVKGASPYGASTVAGGDGSRQPSAIELEAARFQGAHVAAIAAKLSA